jgi:hypothetical protein
MRSYKALSTCSGGKPTSRMLRCCEPLKLEKSQVNSLTAGSQINLIKSFY